MRHWAAHSFWQSYLKLPEEIRTLADRAFELMRRDPRHPSIQLKKAGRYWSARVGLKYRAIAVEVEGGLLWIWIGTHAEYDDLIA
ncbi:MAG: hypothetical protein JST65_20070 [Acidobacteria bacterium]|nr:hypothetical protein [Acidobacteriota bacterium]